MAHAISGSRLVAWGEELRAIHYQLRNALQIARAAIEDFDLGEVSPPSRELLLFCHGFCAALTGHHAGEDAHLFPEIARAHPGLGPVLAELRRDHSMLDQLIGGLERALVDGVPADQALQHLDGIEAVMETHFRYEEKKLLAVLEALHLEASRLDVLGPLARAGGCRGPTAERLAEPACDHHVP